MGESLGNIHVFCRIRPLLGVEVKRGEKDGFVSIQDEHSIVAFQSLSGVPALSGVSKKIKFSFNGVFGPDSSQAEVFDRTARNVVEGEAIPNCSTVTQTTFACAGIMQGYNGTVFAYGQSGSGKTFTMQ
jgi:hypothetical protein